jgi:hypothetical protein
MIMSMAGFCVTGVAPSGSPTVMLELCRFEVHINAMIIIRTLIFNLVISQNFTQHNQRDPNRLVG